MKEAHQHVSASDRQVDLRDFEVLAAAHVQALQAQPAVELARAVRMVGGAGLVGSLGSAGYNTARSVQLVDGEPDRRRQLVVRVERLIGFAPSGDPVHVADAVDLAVRLPRRTGSHLLYLRRAYDEVDRVADPENGTVLAAKDGAFEIDDRWDETVELPEPVVRYWPKTLSASFEAGDDAIAIARVVVKAGGCELDRSYVPPCHTLDGWQPLLMASRELLTVLQVAMDATAGRVFEVAGVSGVGSDAVRVAARSIVEQWSGVSAAIEDRGIEPVRFFRTVLRFLRTSARRLGHDGRVAEPDGAPPVAWFGGVRDILGGDGASDLGGLVAVVTNEARRFVGHMRELELCDLGSVIKPADIVLERGVDDWDVYEIDFGKALADVLEGRGSRLVVELELAGRSLPWVASFRRDANPLERDHYGDAPTRRGKTRFVITPTEAELASARLTLFLEGGRAKSELRLSAAGRDAKANGAANDE